MNIIYSVKWKIARLITLVFYKRLFYEMGDNCTVVLPLLTNDPKRICVSNHVRIREYANIRFCICDAFNYDYPKLVIDDDTGFEQGLSILCGQKIYIGKNVTASAYVTICDTEIDLSNSGNNRSSEVLIGDGSFLGLGAKILAGTVLGKHCIVGANSVVMGGYLWIIQSLLETQLYV